MKPAVRTLGPDPSLVREAPLQAALARSSAAIRRRFDASALATAEQLLLALLRALCALAAVMTVQVLAERLLGQVWPHARLWSVLLPAAVVALPQRAARGLAQRRLSSALRLVGELPGTAALLLALQGLIWLGGLAPLSLGMLLSLLLTQLLYAEVARGLLLQLLWRWRRPSRFVIVGATPQGIAMAGLLRSEDLHAEIVGFVDDRLARVDPRSLPAAFLGSIDSLVHDTSGVDGVVIALPSTASQRVDALAATLRDGRLDIYLAPEAPLLVRAASSGSSGLNSLLLLGAQRLPLQGRIAKRLFDIGFSALALLCFAPLGLLIALLIKLESPGPVIFRQRRYGRGNRLFDLYKFRSMRFDPQPVRSEIRLTERGDARLTRIGAFLRRSSLDEFPQFVNVLLGQMSVVGPRPHPPGVKVGERVYEDVVADFMERYKVRPGLTGWAQVNGLRGSTFSEDQLVQRFVHDIDYIRHWSLELDLWIVMKTVWGGFGGRNAF